MNGKSRSTMTSRHFHLIADTIRTLPAAMGTRLYGVAIAEHFANALATTNPLFDRARFMEAAGVAPVLKLSGQMHVIPLVNGQSVVTGEDR